MSKATARALSILESDQIGRSSNLDLIAVTVQMRQELALIKQSHGVTALRALRLGIVLYRVKEMLRATKGHGHFMPWVKKTFADTYSHKTATDYMRVARLFVERTRANLPEVLALANAQGELLLGDGAPERDLLKKALRFIGEKTITELITEAKKAGGARSADDSDTPPPLPPVNLYGEQAERIRLMKVTLHDPNALLQLSRQEREQMKDDLWSLYDGYRALHEQAFGKK